MKSFPSSVKADWELPGFWSSIGDIDLSAEGLGRIVEVPSIDWHAQNHCNRLVERGFSTVREPVADCALIERVREIIIKLADHGYPASFCFLFDATWELASAAQAVLRASTVQANKFHFDILAWYVTHSGFSPHRDRQPEDVAASFSDNGDAKFVTLWIALTDANPDNSCLYVIPKPHDPGYDDGDKDDEDPLRRSLATKNDYCHICAIPRSSGQGVLFTHRLIHWGSARVPGTTEQQRIAISFVVADPSFEAPYVDPACFSVDGSKITFPQFSTRLLLVCAQLLIYHERFNLPKSCIKSCYEVCKQREAELEPTYRGKVMYEFVQAMRLGVESDNDSPGGANGDGDEEEEAVLEEMLRAESKGDAVFDDDYSDEIEDGADAESSQSESDDDESEASAHALFGGSKRRAMHIVTNHAKRSK